MNQRIGVIGGGQLAWMMSGAAEALGIELIVQTPDQNDPAVKTAADVLIGAIDDIAATTKLGSLCEIITFENEFINLEELQSLVKQGICFRPSLESLAPLLDKYHQRCYLQTIGLPVPQFVGLETSSNTRLNQFGFPVVLKARRHGYDGQGTFIFHNSEDLEATWKKLNNPPMLLEEFVPFERELAVIAGRSLTGEVAIYPVVETQQKNQVCHRVIVPADVPSGVVEQIETIVRTLLEQLQIVGVLGIELFLTRESKVLVNEIAPRTHNSGHYTLDACESSQFEMQLRAIANLPLGSTKLKYPRAVMVNLLGYEHSTHDYQEKRSQLAAISQAYVHWYGKKESRPGRKLGHVTVLLPEVKQQQSQLIAQQIESIWYG